MNVVSSLPSWAGTLPQWFILVSFLFAMYRLSFTDNAAIRRELAARIETLKSDHVECIEKLKKLQDEIEGMRVQRIAEQIAMMRAILRTVEDPALRKQLEMLESLQVNKPPQFLDKSGS